MRRVGVLFNHDYSGIGFNYLEGFPVNLPVWLARLPRELK